MSTIWVEAVERAYVAAATGSTVPYSDAPASIHRARAAVGAIASRYLAVGTPRTFGLIADVTTVQECGLSLVAHRTWFAPTEIRCAAATSSTGKGDLDADFASYVARSTAGKIVSLEEALSCDIVCIHANIVVRATQIRRGTHLNLLAAGAKIDDELRKIATVADENTLGELAAGLVDGRQLDEITVFVADDVGIALGALGTLGPEDFPSGA